MGLPTEEYVSRSDLAYGGTDLHFAEEVTVYGSTIDVTAVWYVFDRSDPTAKLSYVEIDNGKGDRDKRERLVISSDDDGNLTVSLWGHGALSRCGPHSDGTKFRAGPLEFAIWRQLHHCHAPCQEDFVALLGLETA